MKLSKQILKLSNIFHKAGSVIDRIEAQKLIRKADKLQTKISKKIQMSKWLLYTPRSIYYSPSWRYQ